MPTIHYKFADGHTEEIKIIYKIAAALNLSDKYDKKGA